MKLKIEQPHYEILKSYILEGLDILSKPLNEVIEHYQAHGLSPQRLRWDIYWATNRLAQNRTGLPLAGDAVGAPGVLPLYSYMNDDNIDSALRHIYKELGYEWLAQK